MRRRNPSEPREGLTPISKTADSDSVIVQRPHGEASVPSRNTPANDKPGNRTRGPPVVWLGTKSEGEGQVHSQDLAPVVPEGGVEEQGAGQVVPQALKDEAVEGVVLPAVEEAGLGLLAELVFETAEEAEQLDVLVVVEPEPQVRSAAGRAEDVRFTVRLRVVGGHAAIPLGAELGVEAGAQGVGDLLEGRRPVVQRVDRGRGAGLAALELVLTVGVVGEEVEVDLLPWRVGNLRVELQGVVVGKTELGLVVVLVALVGPELEAPGVAGSELGQQVEGVVLAGRLVVLAHAGQVGGDLRLEEREIGGCRVVGADAAVSVLVAAVQGEAFGGVGVEVELQDVLVGRLDLAPRTVPALTVVVERQAGGGGEIPTELGTGVLLLVGVWESDAADRFPYGVEANVAGKLDL